MQPPVADPSSAETERLIGLYDRLRERLLDLSNRNPMLNTRLPQGGRSRRYLQLVDAVPEEAYARLCGAEAGGLDVLPLGEPDPLPDDERTDAFLAALDHARASDVAYLTALAAVEAEGRDDELHLSRLEDQLRVRLRLELGLPPRPARAEISRADQAQRLGIDPSPDLPACRDESQRGTAAGLQTLRYPDELEAALQRMGDDARLALQETGVSTLFLAFGFLERVEAEASDRKLFAPLLLLPVRLDTRRERGMLVHSVVATADVAESNPSLVRMVESRYGRQLPEFGAGDEETLPSPEAYFAAVTAAIEGLKGWRVRRWLVLGHFAFGRFAIYEDLARENWGRPPVAHPLVRAILAGTDRPGEASLDFGPPEDYPVDTPEIETLVPHLVADADASQHSALVDVARGVDLVIEGPPGTGKSQTITNIIAHAIGAGKKVLFLAEKQAALDVVKRRLDEAGLGDFCLELHSDRAAARQVVTTLRKRVELGWGKPIPTKFPADPVQAQARQLVSDYLDALHAPQPDGVTPFQLMWRAVRGARRDPGRIEALTSMTPASDWMHEPERLQSIEAEIEVYAALAADFEAQHGPVGQSPWRLTAVADVPVYDRLALRAALLDWREPILEALQLVREAMDFDVAGFEDLRRLMRLDADLALAPDMTGTAGLDLLGSGSVAGVLRLKETVDGLVERLAVVPGLEELPPDVGARADQLLRSRLGSALAEQVPADLAEAIRGRADASQELAAAIEALMPAMAILGLDRDLPGETFGTLALVCRALAGLSAARRAQLAAHAAVDPDYLAATMALQADLLAAGQAWAERFPGLLAGPPPEPASLRAVADFWSKGRLATAVGAFGAEARLARTIMGQLRPADGRHAAEDLRQLADHLTAVRRFASNPTSIRSFGAAWSGLTTSFAEIKAGLDLRGVFARRLAEAPNGAAVAALTVHVDAAGFDQLADLAGAADRFLAIDPSVRARLAGTTMAHALPMLEADLRAAGALLDLAGDEELGRLAHPLREIADAHRAREALGHARDRLHGHRHGDAVMAAVATVGAERVEAAAEWIDRVRGLGIDEPLRAVLTGERGHEAREAIARISARAAAVLARVEAGRQGVESRFGAMNLTDDDPHVRLSAIDRLVARHGELGDFLILRQAKLDLAGIGLGGFLDTAERIEVAAADLPERFRTVVADRRADLARRAAAPLHRDSGSGLEVRRKLFVDRDRARIAADRASLRDRLLASKPAAGTNLGPKSGWTDMALLRNEFGKTQRFLPVRSLLARSGRAIQTLKPCFMMSPLSLAKFLAPSALAFDLLVIDEASQMRPEDAIGGLLRARKIVVVGDPKQLPPTDFFARLSDEPADDEAAEELEGESILDFCRHSFHSVRRLKWHYRSRCESLIAFSNRTFYDNSLVTFPNARPDSFSIDLVRVDGTYAASRNLAEAEKVAAEAVRLMRHFAGAVEAGDGPVPSLGIVAVNIDQRDLILDCLRRQMLGDPLVERYREAVAARGEPLFVKNLETVQGDERDYVFISLTYGPATPGKAMAQRFGPIGGRNGHRRLNVLFTRARVRIGLFASFGSADVVPSESSGPGVTVLKNYLAYAEERGRLPADRFGAEPDSDFEREVADRLSEAGYQVETQVGVSGYRIDLGVRHPDRPESFLVGIECDGARYHSSRSARERDRLRQEVLAGLGWELIRVWSTDWFADPAEETRQLVQSLEAMRRRPIREGASYRIGENGPEAAADALLSGAQEDPALAEVEIAGLAEFSAGSGSESTEPVPQLAVWAPAEDEVLWDPDAEDQARMPW